MNSEIQQVVDRLQIWIREHESVTVEYRITRRRKLALKRDEIYRKIALAEHWLSKCQKQDVSNLVGAGGKVPASFVAYPGAV